MNYKHNGTLSAGSPKGVHSAEECQEQCQKSNRCNYWTFQKRNAKKDKTEKCWLKKNIADKDKKRNINRVSGPKWCPSM